MAITEFTSGINTNFSTELNDNYALLFNDVMITKIEQLIDRSIIRPNDKVSPLSEAYTDQNGRNNIVSVVPTETTGYFITNKYPSYSLLEDLDSTVENLSSFTNPTYAFDNDFVTGATKTINSTSAQTLGITFPETYAAVARIYCSIGTAQATGHTNTAILQTYNGSTWSNHTTIINAAHANGSFLDTYNSFVVIDANTQGIRLSFATSNADPDTTYTLYELQVGVTQETLIQHTIASGTFNSDVSSAIAAVKVADWESGSSIQYKVANASEDSGCLDFDVSGTTLIAKISTFTAFTAEPTKFIIKLIPKGTSPTTGYPSIYGASIKVL